MAGGLSLQGMLPVVNTFAAFLSSRANEQIYTNACEGTKIIYVCHYAGLIPAGPGESHQSLRDISLLGAIPYMEIIQPCNSAETRMALDYCVNQAQGNCVIRLVIGPCPRRIVFEAGYTLQPGRGVVLHTGEDAVLFAYGPVMIHEALTAAERVKECGFGLKVIHMPWLNRVDLSWLASVTGSASSIYVLEDHSTVGGLGDFFLNRLTESGLMTGRTLTKLAVDGFPAWGAPPEVLKYHGLDGPSIAEKILRAH